MFAKNFQSNIAKCVFACVFIHEITSSGSFFQSAHEGGLAYWRLLLTNNKMRENSPVRSKSTVRTRTSSSFPWRRTSSPRNACVAAVGKRGGRHRETAEFWDWLLQIEQSERTEVEAEFQCNALWRVGTLTLLAVIATEPERTVARDGAVIRFFRRSQHPVLGSPALAAVLAGARPNAVHMILQQMELINNSFKLIIIIVYPAI